jgi:molybdopterin-guanine dinucleotide biosynthesis protein A
MTDFSLAIMAGGKSSRMGRDKAFMKIGGQTIIERILRRTAALGQTETIVITNQPDDYAHLGLPMFTDVIMDTGSLGGIYTAITYSQHEYTLVLACDMPFVSIPLLDYMLSYIHGEARYDVIVPRIDDYPQGLHAIYSKACLEPIHRRLETNRLKVIGFYDDVAVRYLDEAEYQVYDPDNSAFINVNTPVDLEKAQQLAQEKAKD